MKYLRILLLLAITDVFQHADAQITVARIFGDHMILQRNQADSIWGWALPGEMIHAEFLHHRYSVKTSPGGKWEIQLQPAPAGGPYNLRVSGQSNQIVFQDIYLGDVYFCSGQSNMQFNVKQAKNAAEEIAASNYPLIRQLEVAKEGAEMARQDIKGGDWKVSNPANVGGFSAVAYFFARDIFKQQGIPVGIIHSSWGGSTIQAWMDKASLEKFPDEYALATSLKEGSINHLRKKKQEEFDTWLHRFYSSSSFIDSTGNLDRSPAFFNSKAWKPISFPGYLEDQGIEGRFHVNWFKKNLVVNDTLVNEELLLDLGWIAERDITYINGIKVGFTTYRGTDRRYRIPRGLMHNGNNELLICNQNASIKTGFWGPIKPALYKGTLKLYDLSGKWLFQQEERNQQFGSSGDVPSVSFENRYPTLLNNAMIAPVIPYGVKGMIWYQGESNYGQKDCWNYEQMLTNFIVSLRQRWDNPQLPFLIVQLANYGPVMKEPIASTMAIVQEAQCMVSEKLVHVATVVTIDIGDPDNVHPVNKQEVGRRLALAARRLIYADTTVIAQGPVYKNVVFQGSQAQVYYKNPQNGLFTIKGDNTVNGFSICGSDHRFYRAKAVIEGDHITLTSSAVQQPLQVRYAFESSPSGLNLYNRAMLPAVPFRTDNFTEFK